MSRFWESNEEDYPNANVLYHENVRRLLDGKRGQKWLREIEQALLALNDKKLISNQLISVRRNDEDEVVEITGVCALGAYVLYKIDASKITNLHRHMLYEEDGSDAWELAMWAQNEVGLHQMLGQWLEWANDEEAEGMTETQRYDFVLRKVRQTIHA